MMLRGLHQMPRWYVDSWDTQVTGMSFNSLLSSHLYMFLHVDGSPTFHSFYGQGASSIFWIDVHKCIGNERIITECRFTPNFPCNKSQLAGVQCHSKLHNFPNQFAD